MRQRFFRGIPVFAILSFGTAQAEAQNTIGGHFGVLFPLVTRADGTTTNISDDFTVGFPVGITVRKVKPLRSIWSSCRSSRTNRSTST